MPSSTEISSYVKPNYRVVLKLDSFQSKNINADCNCPTSQKGQLCKHIWAVFLAVYEKSPEFFETAVEVIKKAAIEKKATPQSEAQIASKNQYRLKQEAYRKDQYQKQKARAKEFKDNKKKSLKDSPDYPEAVEKALKYFSQNGFSLEDSLSENSISHARKKLSKIFHPDFGGTHAESLELNNYSEVLLRYVK